METTTEMVGGVVLALFGGALLLWCAAEVRLRHLVRRRGVSAVAKVVAEADAHGELDSAPLLSFSAPASVGGPGAKRCAEVVLARPRGHTPLRRPSRFAPGASIRIAYDPVRPSRVVLAAAETPRAAVVDLLWTTLGAGCLAAGACLLVAGFTR
ncbi:DUF3592 domain-containing protein [Kitasatospora sp. NPDC058170]|uniref:DUF3592 domain-containing protein n=1 Tax=Kitasatospora sp. NPDC058170 TaxID=3346364 RepID=UPI0036DD0C8D